MYSLTDKNMAIKEVQRLLGLNQTGQYDAQARLSVSEHQSKNKIPITGTVDYATFESIANAYQEAADIAYARNFLIQPAFPYYFGANDSNVGYINSLIREIFTQYTLESKLPKGNFYSTDTAEAVKALRKIFMLEDGEAVDEILLARMLKERNSIKLKDVK